MEKAVLFGAQFLEAPQAEFCESLGRCSRLTSEPVEVFIPVDAPRWRLP